MSDDALTADLVEVIAKLRRQLAAAGETWTDEKGTEWRRPTAWAYAQVCAAHESLRTQLKTAQREIASLKADAEEREQMLRNARVMVCAMVLSNGGQFHVTRTAMEDVASDDYELVQRDEFTTGAFALTVTRAARAEKPD